VLILSPTCSVTPSIARSFSDGGRLLAHQIVEVLQPSRFDLDTLKLAQLLEAANDLAATLNDPDEGQREAPLTREFDGFFGLARKVPGADALAVGLSQALSELVLESDDSSSSDWHDMLGGFAITSSLLIASVDGGRG
jgi:hypothetical protein